MPPRRSQPRSDSRMNILLTGATGLIGTALLTRRIARAARDELCIHTLDRRAPAVRDACLTSISHQPGEAVAWPHALRCDVFVSCLGTTLRDAGSRAQFVAIDRDLLLQRAQAALNAGAKQAIVVSSIGASPRAASFYLRVKGETEAALAALPFVRLDLIQPGLLIGARATHRPGESWAQRLAPITDRLLLGGLRRYRSIAAEAVAAAMDGLIGAGEPGCHRHQHDAIRTLAASSAR